MQKVTSANKTMNDEDFQRFFTAVYFYLHYIYSLPEDAPEEFFNYDFYDGKDYKPIHNSWFLIKSEYEVNWRNKTVNFKRI